MTWPPTTYPRPLAPDTLCGNCRQRPKRGGDWLCEQCRRELDEQQRQGWRGTGGSMVMAQATITIVDVFDGHARVLAAAGGGLLTGIVSLDQLRGYARRLQATIYQDGQEMTFCHQCPNLIPAAGSCPLCTECLEQYRVEQRDWQAEQDLRYEGAALWKPKS